MKARLLSYRFWPVCFLCIFSSVLFGGCDTIEKDRRVIVVLIDYSASSSNNVLDKYVRIINREIFAKLGRYDCLIVMPIDEGSKREPVKIIYEDMLEKKFTSKSDGFAHAQDSVNLRMQKYVEQIAPKIKEILHVERIKRKAYTNYTDIVGALQQTDNLFEKNNDDPAKKQIWNFITGKPKYKVQNVLVLLSDMIQDSPECSFDNKIGISYRKSSLYINGLKGQGKIPNLKDCKIFVIGSTGKNSTQIDNIQSFWKSYFQASNADLEAYGYDVDDKLDKYISNSQY